MVVENGQGALPLVSKNSLNHQNSSDVQKQFNFKEKIEFLEKEVAKLIDEKSQVLKELEACKLAQVLNFMFSCINFR